MTWRFLAPAETLLGCVPAKGRTVERIGVPLVATEPLREPGIAPRCAPGPRPRHAASSGGFAREHARLFRRPDFPVPSSDEDGTGGGSTRGTKGAVTPLELRVAASVTNFYDRIRSRAFVPRTSWALSLTNRYLAQQKKHRNNHFFHPRVAHKIVHSLSPEKCVFLGIPRLFQGHRGGGESVARHIIDN